MCGEMDDKHVGPTYRAGEDTSGGVESLARIRMDPIILEDLLPSSVVVTVPASIEKHGHPVCQTTPGTVESRE